MGSYILLCIQLLRRSGAPESEQLGGNQNVDKQIELVATSRRAFVCISQFSEHAVNTNTLTSKFPLVERGRFFIIRPPLSGYQRYPS